MLEKRKIYPLDITSVEKDIQTIVEKLNISQAEAIRQAITHYAEYVKGLKIITPRVVPIEQAEREILNYLEQYEGKGIYSDEISEALNLDFDLVNTALVRLWENGKIEPSGEED